MTSDKAETTSALNPPAKDTATGPWDTVALAKFREWDPVFVDQCLEDVQ